MMLHHRRILTNFAIVTGLFFYALKLLLASPSNANR